MTVVSITNNDVSISSNDSTTGVTVIGLAATTQHWAPQPGSPPVSIRADQVYFWTRAWQQLEREASNDTANGDFMTFDSPRKALHWLMSAED